MSTLTAFPRTPGPGAGQGVWARLVPVLRGVWAVLALFAAWLDEQVTALAGIAPLGPRLRSLGEAIADQYRLGRADATDCDLDVIDVEVIEDVFTPDEQQGAA
ncbi:hypothetical protein [Actinomadura rudentiformis]|uniref:Uncharacterized protein n=1 Tax=Actinomadura rudentiformis TaxID=359158 RepID=A0A6H9YJH7_9ACTN|nr:hypothetical protein [Actinomadura rudentiformis]KAB2341515.1 hypothetical protein F8566_40945 [Actinomadura rudentiformis]